MTDYLQYVSARLEIAKRMDHRILVAVTGERQWGRKILESLFENIPLSSVLMAADAQDFPELNHAVFSDSKNFREWLGRETDCLVVDAWKSFDPDVLTALSGTVTGGGVAILLLPPLETWHQYKSDFDKDNLFYPAEIEEVKGFFVKRFANYLLTSDVPILVRQGGNSYPEVTEMLKDKPCEKKSESGKIGKDQAEVIRAIKRVALGHSKRPLVLTADRGRGKSSSLGMSAAELINEKAISGRVIVTAPSRRAVDEVFGFTEKFLLDITDKDRVVFFPPDEVVHKQPEADLLLIDEAAAIPLPVLEKLLKSYTRIVFSTTLHGYEGSGQGFRLRFSRILEDVRPQWQRAELKSPIRWASEDPLEEFLSNAMLLEKAETEEKQLPVCFEKTRIEQVSAEMLVENEELLGEVYSLLVSAHYQTTPRDLYYLLDGLNISVFVAYVDNLVAGVCLVAREGGFDASLGEQVWHSERRPKGHLLPQIIAVQCGFKGGLMLDYLRIVRIAVNDKFRRKGIATALLSFCNTYAEDQGIDVLGSSYGAFKGVVGFWQSCGYRHSRIGLKRDASSASHAVLALKPCTSRGEELVESVFEGHQKSLGSLLFTRLKDLDQEVVALLLSEFKPECNQVTEEINALELFVAGKRSYENVYSLLSRFVLNSGNNFSQARLSKEETVALVCAILQGHDWRIISKRTGLAGKAGIVNVIREAVKKLLVTAKAATSLGD